MNVRAPKPETADEKRGNNMKFTYASGSTPLGGYTIKRGVGRGGFGEVYYGTSDAGKEVALKLIRRNLEVELRGVRHCLNLKHPNLIALFDIRNDDHDDRWVVMEYVSGDSLEDAIDRHPNGMPEEEALRWIHGICAGVAYLHDQGIVHRDLKPGNIFSDESVVKIGDYGLSKFISCSRRSGQTESVGTVHYMAPEIANGRYGREIDTYALGVILYEMLVGKVPFEGESVGEVLMKHLTAEPDLSALKEPYRTIVQRALAKDPDLRLKSVAEMKSMLPKLSESMAGSFAVSWERPRLNDTMPHPSAVGGNQAGASAQPVRVELVEATDEEPILKSIRAAWTSAEQWWTQADLPPVLRVIIIIAVIAVLVSTATAWIPGLFVAFLIYGVYWVIRAVVVQPKLNTTSQPVAGQAPPRPAAAPAAQPKPAAMPAEAAPARPARQAVHRQRRRARKNWREHLQKMVAEKPLRVRITELTGSMLAATIVATVISLIAHVLATGTVDAAGFLWLATVGTIASWAVMIPGKFFEGKVEDQAPKRFTMLVMGMLVGAAAFGLADLLLVQPPYMHLDMPGYRDALASELLPSLKYSQGDPLPVGFYLGYFGALFLILRWWTQADWTRSTRLSIWSIVVCVAMAFFLQFIWWFPQPGGMLIAGIVAVTVQLSSPWLSIAQRRSRLREVA